MLAKWYFISKYNSFVLFNFINTKNLNIPCTYYRTKFLTDRPRIRATEVMSSPAQSTILQLGWLLMSCLHYFILGETPVLGIKFVTLIGVALPLFCLFLSLQGSHNSSGRFRQGRNWPSPQHLLHGCGVKTTKFQSFYNKLPLPSRKPALSHMLPS